MFTKALKEVFQAFDGKPYDSEEDARHASLAHMVDQAQYVDEDGPTGRFCAPNFLWQLQQHPEVVAWLVEEAGKPHPLHCRCQVCKPTT